MSINCHNNYLKRVLGRGGGPVVKLKLLVCKIKSLVTLKYYHSLTFINVFYKISFNLYLLGRNPNLYFNKLKIHAFYSF